jgi:hypothetical protein
MRIKNDRIYCWLSVPDVSVLVGVSYHRSAPFGSNMAFYKAAICLLLVDVRMYLLCCDYSNSVGAEML